MVQTPPDPTETLIDDLYRTVGTEDALSAVVKRVREGLRAQQALIQTVSLDGHPSGMHLAAAGVPVQSLIEYHVHYAFDDPWKRRAIEQQRVFEGAVVRGAHLVPPDELRQTRFWREFLAPQRVVDRLSGIVEMPTHPGVPPTVISLHRTGDQPLFGAQDEGMLRLLMPHLRRVLQLQRRLAPQLALGRSMHELFEQLDMPMGFVDAEGRLRGTNRAAQAALATGTFWRRDAEGRLQWRPDGRGWRGLATDLGALREQPAMAQLLVADDGRACMGHLLAARGRFQPPDSQDRVRAWVSLRAIDPARDAECVRRRFDLTAAEWAVALLLGQGLDADAIASRMGVRLSTVRTHIAHLLAKTQSDRQLLMLARLKGWA